MHLFLDIDMPMHAGKPAGVNLAWEKSNKLVDVPSVKGVVPKPISADPAD